VPSTVRLLNGFLAAAFGGDLSALLDILVLWVPNWSSTSCDLVVFVYQAAEPVATSDAKLR
jgi:uncharacterized membrane protein